MVKIKEERPKGEMDIKSNSNPEVKPKIIAKREPLLIATKLMKISKRSAVIKKNGI